MKELRNNIGVALCLVLLVSSASAQNKPAVLFGSPQGASYGWVDRPAGIVQLPLARAMELTVQQHASQP